MKRCLISGSWTNGLLRAGIVNTPCMLPACACGALAMHTSRSAGVQWGSLRGFEDSRLESVVNDGLSVQQHHNLHRAHGLAICMTSILQ